MTEFKQELEQKCAGMEEVSRQIHLSLDEVGNHLFKCDQRIGEIINQVRDHHIDGRPEDWYDNQLLLDFEKMIIEKFGDQVEYLPVKEDKVIKEKFGSYPPDKEDKVMKGELRLSSGARIYYQYDLNDDWNIKRILEKWVEISEKEDVKFFFEVIKDDPAVTGMFDYLKEKTDGRFRYFIIDKETENEITVGDDDWEDHFEIEENKIEQDQRIIFEDEEVMAKVKEYVIEELLSLKRPECLEIGLVMMDDEGELMTEYEECTKRTVELQGLFDSTANRLVASVPPALLSVMFKSHLNQYTTAFKESRELIDRKKKYDRQRVEITDLIEKIEKVNYLNPSELDSLKGVQKRSNDELNQLLEEIRIRKEMVEKFVRSPAIKDFKKIMRESLNMICQICYQNKIDRSLKCGHLFCHECLTKMKRGDSITCAFCNQISSTTDCGRCSENTIRNIYLNSGGS